MNFLPRGTKSSEKMRLPTEREREREKLTKRERERENTLAASNFYVISTLKTQPDSHSLLNGYVRPPLKFLARLVQIWHP